MPAPPLYQHQTETVEFGMQVDRVFDTSDPGTGKTRAHIELYKKRHEAGLPVGRCLVVCPKSIMYPAWGKDIIRYAPGFTFTIADAKNRESAFAHPSNFVIINHDGVKWLQEHTEVLKDFNTLIVDESTAFKHRTSQRSKALASLTKHFTYRALLTGTPYTNSITELWHQAFVLDDGARLGTRYWQFRSAVCISEQVGPDPRMVEWKDKPGANDAVSDLLADVSIRHIFEECIDIPPNVTRTIPFQMSAKQKLTYDLAIRDAMIYLESGDVTAINAAALRQKLLQIASGAVYDGDSISHVIANDRVELIMELIFERPHTLVAFNWAHQKQELVKAAEKYGFTHAVIDGMTPSHHRNDIIEAFQNGELKVLFAHPATAAHGLTLTRGTTTIWASPTHNAEHYLQFNRRIYRAGQTQRTETIHIAAEDTIDDEVYARLSGKIDTLNDLLSLIKASYHPAHRVITPTPVNA